MSAGAQTTEADFRTLFDEVCTWERWPERAGFGALNYLTPERVVAAAGLVRDGRAVSLGRPLDTEKRPDNPRPAEHHMTQVPDVSDPSVQFAKDYVGVDFHSEGHSHIDALTHVVFRGVIYGGLPAKDITAEGVRMASIGLLHEGLTARGVLLDIPALLGVERLQAGTQVHPGEMEAAEAHEGVRVGHGDVLLVRTGVRHAGLHPTAARLLSERQVCALGSDGNNEAAPSRTEGVDFPIHVLAVNAMGLHLLDYLQLEELASVCAALGRWEFMVTVAPLRIDGGTGSPVNPIALF